MKPSTERAFKVADQASRILGDYKHSIWLLKTRENITDKERLDTLLKYVSDQERVLRSLTDEIANAQFDLDSEVPEMFEEHRNLSIYGHGRP